MIEILKKRNYYFGKKAACLPSRKLTKLDEPDTQDTAGEARTSS